ncbi:MAG TPA: YggS family pyridoxal phosphate-dependent enzyme [Pyrinomonadaceae bacterium]|nr:YggS family pyridoxal phosphate-dependent enzyme [Pyrinomonadaceae bacterium]
MPEHEGWEQLRQRLASVRGRIRQAAELAGRRPEEITLVAIGKTHPIPKLEQAIREGVTDLGENRVQEAQAKIELIGRTAVRWHLVGHLQTNKVRRAVQLFDVIHSVDSKPLVERLESICSQEQRTLLPVLLQVDLAREATKSGLPESDLRTVADAVLASSHLELSGLMVLPPYFDDSNKARPYFSRLCELRDRLGEEGYFNDRPGELSMGMTHDFEVAIAEGATMVRIGTAIFGER